MTQEKELNLEKIEKAAQSISEHTDGINFKLNIGAGILALSFFGSCTMSDSKSAYQDVKCAVDFNAPTELQAKQLTACTENAAKVYQAVGYDNVTPNKLHVILENSSAPEL
ncbi:MAG: hypothetical protein ACRBDI_03285 [Alphaproteobacteria bacterium]